MSTSELSDAELERVHAVVDELIARMKAGADSAELLAQLDPRDREAVEPHLRIQDALLGRGGARPSPAFGTSAASSPSFVAGRYEILERLGVGGQGTVFRARDTKLGREVALKQFNAPWLAEPEAHRRFEREAALACQISHAGVRTVYDHGFDADGVPYIAMELVRGQTLQEKLGQEREERDRNPRARRTRSEILSIARLLAAIGRALHAIHEGRILHRDIKPGNIMITEEGNPVIMDFGLARLEGPDASSLTRTGELLGTSAYLAPERIDSRTDTYERTVDVWALGVTAYEMLTLSRPFPGPSYAETERQVLRFEPVRLRRLEPRSPQDLETVIQVALEKDESRRYGTALEFALDLERVCEHRPVAARPASWPLRVRRWVRRHPAATLVVAAFALGFVVTFWQWRRAEGNLVRFEQMSDVSLVASLTERAGDLWPPRPSLIASMDAWLRDADRVCARLPLHEASLRELSGPSSAQGSGSASPGHRRRHADLHDEIESLELEITTLSVRAEGLSEFDPWRWMHRRPSAGPFPLTWIDQIRATIEALEWRRRDLAELRRQLRALKPPPVARRNTSELWRRQVLSALVRELRELRRLMDDVRGRRASAARIVGETVDAHAEAWAKCLADIRRPDSPYRGLSMPPQTGLVPLGVDAASGLWEFWCPETGEKPEWQGTVHEGRVLPLRTFAAVLVLLPGGTFAMGASRERGAGNYDPAALGNEWPVHSVRLDPFFVSKYELTRAQWMHVLGSDPSFYRNASRLRRLVDVSNPVENVSRVEAAEMLRRVGLQLPTEAQWEYAARAGTSSPWFTGSEVAQIQGYGNLADADALESGQASASWSFERSFRDGHVVHAPVGSFKPNPFGLHDVIGGVWEWTRGRYSPYNRDPHPSHGYRPGRRRSRSIARGGSFAWDAARARSSFRFILAPESRSDDLGLRPVRAIEK